MPKVVLVRHGQTLQNRLGLIQGRADTDLSDEGVAQARRLAIEFGDVEFDRVYSSPMLRALRTTQIIVDGRELPIITDDRLVEIDQGDWTLKKGSELYKSNDRYKTWATNPIQAYPPNGETIHDVAGRAKAFLEDVKGYNILTVAHAGVIAVLRTVLESRPLEKTWELLPRNGQAIILPVAESERG